MTIGPPYILAVPVNVPVDDALVAVAVADGAGSAEHHESRGERPASHAHETHSALYPFRRAEPYCRFDTPEGERERQGWAAIDHAVGGAALLILRQPPARLFAMI